ncbi:MAG: hypothetical protein KDD94_13425 [Calditrichaeota bacterium]|nr:hypothetical protein [Calditrichota bacterium]
MNIFIKILLITCFFKFEFAQNEYTGSRFGAGSFRNDTGIRLTFENWPIRDSVKISLDQTVTICKTEINDILNISLNSLYAAVTLLTYTPNPPDTILFANEGFVFLSIAALPIILSNVKYQLILNSNISYRIGVSTDFFGTESSGVLGYSEFLTGLSVKLKPISISFDLRQPYINANVFKNRDLYLSFNLYYEY